MTAHGYGAIGLIGSNPGDVDVIPSGDLATGDICIATTADATYTYRYLATSGVAENSPWVIAPDDIGVSDGRWILINVVIDPYESTMTSDETFTYVTGDRRSSYK